jgi:hypothetical protein
MPQDFIRCLLSPRVCVLRLTTEGAGPAGGSGVVSGVGGGMSGGISGAGGCGSSGGGGGGGGVGNSAWSGPTAGGSGTPLNKGSIKRKRIP